jgi:hypothetical protein
MWMVDSVSNFSFKRTEKERDGVKAKLYTLLRWGHVAS